VATSKAEASKQDRVLIDLALQGGARMDVSSPSAGEGSHDTE